MNTEVRPIAVIYYLPDALSTKYGREVSMYEVNEMFKKVFTDYHVLAIPSRMSIDGSCEDVRLQVFHPKDFTPIQFQELEVMIKETIENIKPKANIKDY